MLEHPKKTFNIYIFCLDAFVMHENLTCRVVESIFSLGYMIGEIKYVKATNDQTWPHPHDMSLWGSESTHASMLPVGIKPRWGG